MTKFMSRHLAATAIVAVVALTTLFPYSQVLALRVDVSTSRASVRAAVSTGPISVPTPRPTPAPQPEPEPEPTPVPEPEPTPTPEPEPQPEPTPEPTPEPGPTPEPEPTPTTTPSGGMVSFNLDDGWRTGFDKGLPLFDARGMKVTYYPVTQTFDFPDFITADMLQDVQARGHEVGNHSRTHADLTTLDAQEAQTEVVGANDELAALGIAATSFAYPYGASNTGVRSLVEGAGFAGARGTDNAYVDKNADRFNLPAWDIGGMSFAQVKGIIDGATAQKKWAILIVHKVDIAGDPESVSSDVLEQALDYVAAQGVEVVTNAEGLAKMETIE